MDVRQRNASAAPFRKQRKLKIAVLLALLLLSAQAANQNQPSPDSIPNKKGTQQAAPQTRTPNRSSAPLFKGGPGKNKKPEISFDPATRMVTIKLALQTASGAFMPNIRRDNFVVYENGVRQQTANVDVEHAPISLELLMEFGGRTPGFNRELGHEVSRAGQQLVDEIGKEDTIAIWKYNDKVQKLADFSQSRDTLSTLFFTLGTPEFSEVNLYDALIFIVGQMQPLTKRKAIVLVSSGVDTFSKAKYEDVLKAVSQADTPIYVVSLARVLHEIAEMHDHPTALARIGWRKAETQLQEIARVSGGRAYSPENTVDLSPIYDDMMEDLRIRYVITYRSSNDLDPNSPRQVRVELLNSSQTADARATKDIRGGAIPTKVIAQGSYIPSAFVRR